MTNPSILEQAALNFLCDSTLSDALEEAKRQEHEDAPASNGSLEETQEVTAAPGAPVMDAALPLQAFHYGNITNYDAAFEFAKDFGEPHYP
jgi:hypothetical protein